jgi:FKBP-type peptidyl-prolyl cis-trans isomerase FkpA
MSFWSFKNIVACLLFFAFTGLFLSCKEKKNEMTRQEITNQKETLVRINRYLVGADADKIRGYIKRRNWKMDVSPTGLWYSIYEKGGGEMAGDGKTAFIKYKISLLDGTLCYSSDETGIKKFKIGQGGVESGLEQGILLLRVGDKARFVMPPHLAEGLVGDQQKIPARSCILYEVELVKIAD